MPVLLFLTSVPSRTSQSTVLRRSSSAFKGLDLAPFGVHQCCSQNHQVVLPSQSYKYTHTCTHIHIVPPHVPSDGGPGNGAAACILCVVLQAAATGPHAIWQGEASIIVYSIGKDKSIEKVVAHLSSAHSQHVNTNGSKLLVVNIKSRTMQWRVKGSFI